MGVISEAPNLLDKKDVAGVIASLKRLPSAPALLVIDTLASVLHGDENSGADMGALLRACQLITEEINATVLLVHHTAKSDTTTGRGHGSLKCTADVEIGVSVDKLGIRSAKSVKVKDAPNGITYAFRLGVRSLGVDADGDEVTSCFVDFGIASPPNEEDDASLSAY
jgi:hypothetical protein